jgi:hypothetical protein
VRYGPATAIPHARPMAVLGIAPQTAERVRGRTPAVVVLVRETVGWTKESIEVHRSGIAYRAVQGVRETGRPLEAVGNVAEPGRLGTVLALIAGGLARTWAPEWCSAASNK